MSAKEEREPDRSKDFEPAEARSAAFGAAVHAAVQAATRGATRCNPEQKSPEPPGPRASSALLQQGERQGSRPQGSRLPHAALQVLAFVGIYLIWGSTYLGIRVAVRTIPPLLLAGARSLLAGTALLLVLRALGVRQPSAREWKHAMVSGILLLTFGNGLVTWAEEVVPSGFAALCIAATPLYMAALGSLRRGSERPSARALLGIALGMVGMGLLVAPEPDAIVSVDLAHALALILAGFTWAAGSLYARYAPRHHHVAMAAAQQMTAGGSTLVVLGALRGELANFSLNALSRSSVLAFLYLTLFGSIIAFSLYAWVLVASTPTRISTIPYVTPVVAVLLGWLALGETLTTRGIAAGLLIVLAVVLMSLKGTLGLSRTDSALRAGQHET